MELLGRPKFSFVLTTFIAGNITSCRERHLCRIHVILLTTNNPEGRYLLSFIRLTKIIPTLFVHNSVGSSAFCVSFTHRKNIYVIYRILTTEKSGHVPNVMASDYSLKLLQRSELTIYIYFYKLYFRYILLPPCR